jgi:hypothetical protein
MPVASQKIFPIDIGLDPLKAYPLLVKLPDSGFC